MQESPVWRSRGQLVSRCENVCSSSRLEQNEAALRGSFLKIIASPVVLKFAISIESAAKAEVDE